MLRDLNEHYECYATALRKACSDALKEPYKFYSYTIDTKGRVTITPPRSDKVKKKQTKDARIVELEQQKMQLERSLEAVRNDRDYYSKAYDLICEKYRATLDLRLAEEARQRRAARNAKVLKVVSRALTVVGVAGGIAYIIVTVFG